MANLAAFHRQGHRLTATWASLMSPATSCAFAKPIKTGGVTEAAGHGSAFHPRNSDPGCRDEPPAEASAPAGR